MPLIETVNEAITRYFDKDGKELTAEEYERLQTEGKMTDERQGTKPETKKKN